VKDAADVLSFFASQAGTLRFFALLFPGFVALAVYDLRVPGERRKFADMGIALVAYSIVIDGLSALYLSLFPIPRNDTAMTVAAGLIADVLVPGVVGWCVVDLRELLASRGLVLSAIPKAWDEFFSRLSKLPETGSIALVLTLTDGRKIGGFWAEAPFASSYPADEDLLIPVPARIDQESGRFVQRTEGSKGLLVKRSDIISIEAFDGNAVADAAIPQPAASLVVRPTAGP
jgi:hypothetical protein